MSLSSTMARIFLLGGLIVGGGSIACAAAQGVAPQAGLKKITATFSGSVSPAGAIENNKTGKIIGEIDRTGVVYNNTGTIVGSIDAKGIVHDAKGVPVAQVDLNNRLAGVAFLLGQQQ